MRGLIGIARLFLFSSLLALPAPLLAQYMYLDANGDGIHTAADVMSPLGTPQVVDVWLNRTQNRDGSPAVCNTNDGDLATWNSYAVHIDAVGGTASFEGFANHVTNFNIACVSAGTGFLSNTSQMSACWAGFPTVSPGLVRLFTMTVTGLAGSPRLDIVRTNSLDPNFTSFGTSCFGNDFDNTYKLGSDWFDWDGLAAATVEVFAARAFTTKANRILRLGSGKAYWTIQIEPVGSSFNINEVGLGTIRMISPGTGSVSEIHASAERSTAQGDADGNGVSDISAVFAKTDLEALFSNLSGTSNVPVTLEGQVASGGIFRAQTDITVSAGDGSGIALRADRSGISYVLSTPGRVRAEMFDARGRLVRVLVDRNTGIGPQRVSLDAGRGRTGLASGVYFVRVATPDGTETLRVAFVR